VLRVSMVRIELCSTRTMGRSAWSGIVCRGRRGGMRVVVSVSVFAAAATVRVRLRQRSAAGPAERVPAGLQL
jgi:hypothetical protein